MSKASDRERSRSPRGTGLASGLSPTELDGLARIGRRLRYRTGSIIMNEGETSGHVLLILGGRVKVSSFTEDGREMVLAVRSPGDLVGELSAIDGLPHSATVGALDAVDAVVVSASAFKEFLTAHPHTALMLLAITSDRLRDADRKRVEFGAHDAAGRVAARLVEMAERFGQETAEGVRIDLPLSQIELAGWTGLARESVAKALRQLRTRGWVKTYRKGFLVTDISSLRRRAT
jgi:CRP/FNR family transcriptional regulator, cyclic AMP receptor protein